MMTDGSALPAPARSRSAISDRIARIPESSTVAIADIASALRRRGEKVIDFSAGRAAEHTHPFICSAASAAMADGDTHQTLARGTPDFLTACAAKLQRDNDLYLNPDTEIMATMGCKEGLLLSLLSILDPGDEVIIEDPCFVSYRPTVELCGGVTVSVPLRPENKYRWTRKDLAAAVTPKTKAIIFCNPHNPTGVVYTREDLEVIRSVATANNLIVIADEIYDATVWNGRKHVPIASLADMQARTIGLMGMTKSFSMGGWRVGYAYADRNIISKMVVVHQHIMTCASSIAQRGGTAALSDDGIACMRPIWQEWEERCMHAADRINEIPGLTTSRPEGTFYCWVNISETKTPSRQFAQQLLKREKVAVVPGGTFGSRSDGFIRVTCVRGWDELNEGISGIARYVQSL
jgi:aspartate/methionine/tyrosine aminotransferase